MHDELSPSVPPAEPGATMAASGEGAARPALGGDSPPGYEIVRELGRGGMGVVYLARDAKLNRTVALKMVLAGAHATQAALARFLAEAEAVAALTHPGIVAIYEIGRHGELPYFTLEFCPSGSLTTKVKDAPLAPREAAAVVEQIARAVAYAHAKGIIHRDLKPDNVLFGEHGEPKVTDFGLAKRLETESGMTATGAVMGTPSYMAPEQAEGKKEVGAAADVYSLGAILYRLLGGRPPFQAATPLDTMLQVVKDEAVSLRQLNRHAPRDLETIAHKCLAKNPAKRYPSAESLAEDLRRWLNGEPITARPVGRPERALKWMKRHPAGTAFIATLLAGIALSTFFAVRASRKADEATANAQGAQRQEKLAHRRLYNANIGLMRPAWEAGVADYVSELLESTRPKNTGGEDLRGFEWYYWWGLVHSDLRTFRDALSAAHEGSDATRFLGLAYSPDGKHLAAGTQHGTVRIWEISTGHEVRALRTDGGNVSTVAYSPDGKFLLADCSGTASSGPVLEVWEVADGRRVKSLPGSASGAAFNATSDRLLCRLKDSNELTVLELGTWRRVTSVRIPPGIRRFAYGAVERLAATVKDGITVWDARDGRELTTLSGATDAVLALTFSPDGRRVAAASIGRRVRLWDATDGKLLSTIDLITESAHLLAFSPDGARLASTSDNRAIRIWDAASGREIRTIRGHSGMIRGLAFSPDGHRLASASTDGTVRLWDAYSAQDGRQFEGRAPGFRPTFSPDGRLMAFILHNEINVYDAASKKLLFMVQHPRRRNAQHLAFSPDATHLASAATGLDETPEVRIWDTNTRREVATLDNKLAYCLRFSPDGTRLGLVTNHGVEIHNLVTRTSVVERNAAPTELRGACLSPELDKVIIAEAAPSFAVAISGIATAADGLTLRRISSRTLTERVESLAFSSDGQVAAIGLADGLIELWYPERGTAVQTLRGHRDIVESLAFSPDGRRLFSSSGDGTVKVWDPELRQALLTLTFQGHSPKLALSPDGRTLIVSGGNLTQYWDLHNSGSLGNEGD